MAELPSGTVTFLFTDIEGSTRLWERHSEAMRSALGRHDVLLRDAIEARGGYVFKPIGDAVCAAFDTAPSALAAAAAAQGGLQAEPWRGVGGLPVRMALHTGGAEERDGDYFGPSLSRVARLLATGLGGQVLLSQPTYDLVRDDLPAGASLRDLGEHRLKDLTRPEQAARLFGAAEALRSYIGAPLSPAERLDYEQDVAATSALLGEDPYAAAWAEGRAMSLEQAVAYALEDPRSP